MPTYYQRMWWWPWVKNCYGETDLGYKNFVPAIARMWIDEDLKDDMGY